MRRRPPILAALAAAAVLAGCSTPVTRVVLLPQEDGSPSAVVVRTKGGEQVLSQPFRRATAPAGSTAAPRVDDADPSRLRTENQALFDLAPARPQRYTLYFELGGTTLTASSRETVNEMLAAALARPGGDIVVTGHTDTIGSGPRNDELSRARAQEMRQILIEQGFPATRIEAVGRGERELAVPTADEVDEPRNRRVTIEVR